MRKTLMNLAIFAVIDRLLLPLRRYVRPHTWSANGN